MKTRVSRTTTLALLLVTFHLSSSTSLAQSTVFTYQGRLDDSGQRQTLSAKFYRSLKP